MHSTLPALVYHHGSRIVPPMIVASIWGTTTNGLFLFNGGSWLAPEMVRYNASDILAYYEPLHFAPQVRCATLLVTGADPAQTQPLVEQLGGPVETYQSAHSGYRDGVYQATWLAHRYGITAPALPAAWQS